MPENINIKESDREFMVVLDMALRRIEDDHKIIGTTNMRNSEASGSVKATSYFSYQSLPSKTRVFTPKGLGANSSVLNVSVGSQRDDIEI
jgi:sensor histidine kinase regulating citrate/malate metabolism